MTAIIFSNACTWMQTDGQSGRLFISYLGHVGTFEDVLAFGARAKIPVFRVLPSRGLRPSSAVQAAKTFGHNAQT